MRILILSSLILTASCGGTVANENVGTSSLDIEVSAPSFVYCECHHGFGPGIDGKLRVTMRNSGTAAVRVVPKTISLSTNGRPVFATDTTGVRVVPDREKAFSERVLQPGEEIVGTVTAYIDPGAGPWPPSGSFTASFEVENGGTTQSGTSPAFEIRYQAVEKQ